MVVPGVGVEGAPGGDDPLLAVRLFLLSDFLFILSLSLVARARSTPLPSPSAAPLLFSRARRVGLEAGREGSHPRKVWEQFWSGGEESPTSTGLQKKRKAPFPPAFQNGTGPSSPLLALGSLEQLWKVATLRPMGRRQKKMPINSKYR